MTPHIIDAFTTQPFHGNPAGVALIQGPYPPDGEMAALAKELGFSETAFVQPAGPEAFTLRYFTPTDEVDLCGHATIASFHGLWKWGLVSPGHRYLAKTRAGSLAIRLDADGTVWMDMAPPQAVRDLSPLGGEALGGVFVPTRYRGRLFTPAIIPTGLPDMMMPLPSRDALATLAPDLSAIARFSNHLGVVGVHAFVPGDETVTAYCRNFAPLFGIPEEAATGTANGALTFYLYQHSVIAPNVVNCFIQGEAMGRPSRIYSCLSLEKGALQVRIGGQAVIH